jgi:caa(3)-type oxidase subunit IV
MLVKNSHHPSPGYLQYIGIAVALGVLTAIEFLVVSEFWPAALSVFTNPILLALTVIKVALVALFYMHLKYDSRLYSSLFVGAIILLAIPLTLVLMILFQYTV